MAGDKKRDNYVKIISLFCVTDHKWTRAKALFQGRKGDKSQMIKKIAAILVTYNGEFDKETIFKVTTIDNLGQLNDLMKRAREMDKKCGVVSAYRIQIFQ